MICGCPLVETLRMTRFCLPVNYTMTQHNGLVKCFAYFGLKVFASLDSEVLHLLQMHNCVTIFS